MALIINIDTATDTASVSLSDNGESLAIVQNENQKEHASFVHVAIEAVLRKCNFRLPDVDAFAVTSGPGSYTGLRVGMATAKGLSYALSKPLITVGTLEAMCQAGIMASEDNDELLFCPMIDARRMEVFTAVYDRKMNVVMEPTAMILEEGVFEEFLNNHKVAFFGSGSFKLTQIKASANAFFSEVNYTAKHVGILADKAFKQEKFADISYSEPAYLKEFYTVIKK